MDQLDARRGWRMSRSDSAPVPTVGMPAMTAASNPAGVAHVHAADHSVGLTQFVGSMGWGAICAVTMGNSTP